MPGGTGVDVGGTRTSKSVAKVTSLTYNEAPHLICTNLSSIRRLWASKTTLRISTEFELDWTENT